MIKLMLVAGSSSKNLAEFLNKRGTFSVTNVYTSLNSCLGELQTQIIRSDKFLYLYNPDNQDVNFDIRADMRALGVLLKDSSFFNPGELIFMLKNSEDSVLAMRYFKTIMKDTGYTNYSIKQIDGQLSYEAIYNSIMGVSTVKDFNNVYKDFYKVERNSEADLAYAARDDKNLKIEPFTFDALAEYEDRKETAIKTDSGQIISDNADTNLELRDNPNFAEFSVNNTLVKKKVVLVSGRAKSGKSVWSTVLATSSVSAGRATAIFDYTDNSDMEQHLRMADFIYQVYSLKEAMLLNSVDGASLSLVNVRNKKEDQVKLNFLRHKLTLTDNTFDTIIIVCELDDFEAIYNTIYENVTNVVLTCTALLNDLSLLLHWAEMCKDCDLKIILNECINLLGFNEFCTAEQARMVFPEPYVLIKAKNFTKLNFGEKIYKSIVGD